MALRTIVRIRSEVWLSSTTMAGWTMFRASGTSYSLRSPCVKLWRFPSHTFSEHSTMCLNTRTQRNRHEENAPAACILGFGGRDGLPWQHFKNSCLRFPCFTHFALCTALLCICNRHVESAYALSVLSIWNAKPWTMRGMHFPATRTAARKSRRPGVGPKRNFVLCKMSLFVWREEEFLCLFRV